MFKKLSIAVLLILALVLPMESAFAIPTNCIGGMADFFYGALKINGANASNHTRMRAKILGEIRGSYNTSAAGRYGDAEIDNKFAVSGVAEGYEAPQNITFEVFANAQWKQALLNGSLHSFPYTCGNEYSLNMGIEVGCADTDGDGVCNDADICPGFNDNADSDLDGTPNGCDICNGFNDGLDFDGDGVPNGCDICFGSNDNIDTDGDGDPNGCDNCPITPNADQANSDGDGAGDACDVCAFDPLNDGDGDGWCGNIDNCPLAPNADQANSDGDGLGNACDACPLDFFNDADGDGDCGNIDNCPGVFNPGQEDTDGDELGDVCDPCTDSEPDGFAIEGGLCGPVDCNDLNGAIFPGAPELCDEVDSDCDGSFDEGCGCPDSDGDGDCNDADNCPGTPNPDQANSDGDAFGDVCDTCPLDPLNDADADGFCGNVDNCPGVFNPDQANSDGDGLGNVCDECPLDFFNDADGDGDCGDVDNCPGVFNPGQEDTDGDGLGDACDEGDSIETSIPIFNGWTAFALPFKPIGIDNSQELGDAISGVPGLDCDVIMRFNGNTQLMEEDILAIPEPSFALTPTQAYFIHCEGSGTFVYEGEVWAS